ncbi:hypothetical protein A2U01_0109897, partial [Trifolium medium]|nr:hypothetical protein [Trifolium medium]
IARAESSKLLAAETVISTG